MVTNSYNSIGHDLGEESILWIFRNGKIETCPITNNRYKYMGHDTMFNEDDGKWELSGRYDPKKLTISLAGAIIYDWPARKVDYVKKKLWKTFPEALKIEEFR